MAFNQTIVDTCMQATALSDDPDTKVGCVITRGDEILVVESNRIVIGAAPIPERLERPNKYTWIEHAERAAIYQAAKKGISLEGTTMYLTWWPCTDCCRALINSGIKKLVVPHRPNHQDARWGEQFKITTEMVDEVGIEVVYSNDA